MSNELEALLEDAEKDMTVEDLLADAEADMVQEEPAVEAAPVNISPVTQVPTGFTPVFGGPPSGEQVEAGASSFAQGASLGLYDRLKAAMTGRPYEEIYGERAAMQEKFPAETTALEAAGTLATGAAPFGAGMGVAGLTATGATFGGIEGAARAKPSEDIVEKGVEGAAIGAGTALLGSTIGAIPKALGREVETQSVKALGLNKGAIHRKLRNLDKSGQNKTELAKFAKEEGILRAGSNSSEMLDRTIDLQKQVGSEIEDVLSTGAPIEIKPLVQRLRSVAETEAEGLDKAVAKQIHEYADDLESLTSTSPLPGSKMAGPRQAQDTITPEQLRELKTKLGKKVKDFTKDGDIIEARKRVYGELADAVEGSLDEQQKLRLRELNKKYTNSKNIEDGLTQRSDAEMNSDMFNWQNMMLGTAGHPAAPVAKELIRSYGRQLASLGLSSEGSLAKVMFNNKIAKAFKEAAEKGGESAIAATHMKLMQTDREYRERYNKEKGKEK